VSHASFCVLRAMACHSLAIFRSQRPARHGSLVQETSAQAPEGLNARVCAQRFARS